MQTFAQCKNRDINAQNRWFRECDKNNMPYVYVGLRNKYASVNWDCISLNPQQDSQITEDADDIMQEILAVFHQYAEKKSRYDFSAFCGSIDNLSPDNAQLVADRVFTILQSRLVGEPVA